MNAVLAVSWQYLRGVLPYPDMRRRWRMRHAAFSLVTCKKWPGDDATGSDAAQLALLRLLWLQRLTRNAVGVRRNEEAVLLARGSLETCIVGLYCLYSGDAIAHLSAANYGAEGRAVSYLTDGDLGSRTAIDAAAVALGEVGPDLNVRDLALWLEREHDLVIAARLYHAYYVPLSHLFTHGYAFALMRHVGPDGVLRQQPGFPWTRRSAARLADACAAVLAANIADKSGAPSELFDRYATAHVDRLLTPKLVFTVKGAIRSGPRRSAPRRLRAMIEAELDADGTSRVGDPLRQDAGAGSEFASFFDPLPPQAREAPNGMLAQPDEEYLAGQDPGAEDEQQARHRRRGRAAADR